MPIMVAVTIVLYFVGSLCFGFSAMWLVIRFTLPSAGLATLSGAIAIIAGAVVLGFFGKFADPNQALPPGFLGYPIGLALAIFVCGGRGPTLKA